jgi:hypothetical protein
MSQIFPKWTLHLPLILVLVFVLFVCAVTGFFWYYGSPKYTDVGYRPVQPVPYSHKLHAGDLGMDCRYCHSSIERSPIANVPPTNTCMNCHKIILTDSEKLLPVRESFASGKPIQWVKIHRLPDFVYFDHSIHLWAGVGCSSCHGNIAEMDVVQQAKPLSMSWCLDCHRNPDNSLRLPSEITNMTWTPPANQTDIAAQLKKEKNINPPVNCSGCHR